MMPTAEDLEVLNALPEILSLYCKKMIDERFTREEAVQFALELQAWILTKEESGEIESDPNRNGLVSVGQGLQE